MQNNLAIVPYVPQPPIEKFLRSFALRELAEEEEILEINAIWELNQKKVKESDSLLSGGFIHSWINPSLRYIDENPINISLGWEHHIYHTSNVINLKKLCTIQVSIPLGLYQK